MPTTSDNLNQLYNLLRNLTDRVSEVQVSLAKIVTLCPERQKILDGLTDRVGEVEKSVRAVEVKVERMIGARSVIAGVIGAIGAGIIEIVVWLCKKGATST